MNTSWTIRPFDVNAEDDDAWRRYHRFRRLRHEESEPDEPVTPDDVSTARMQNPWPSEVVHRFIAEADGEVVGNVKISTVKPGHPEYDTNKHLAWVQGGVVERHRRRGIGRGLLERVREVCVDRGIQRFTSHATDAEPDGIAVLEHVGGERKQTERLSRLRYEDIDWDQMEDWVDAMEERAPGFVLEIWPDRVPEEVYAEYATARTRLMNLMPWDDLDHGDIVVSVEDLEEQQRQIEREDAEHHTVIARDPQGTIVAITDVRWTPAEPDWPWQWFTGVDPATRGRGLGKAIKARMVLHLREQYDFEWISTGNSSTNAAMLAINEQMGFRQHKIWYAYQTEVDRLATYLDGAASNRTAGGSDAGAPSR